MQRITQCLALLSLTFTLTACNEAVKNSAVGDSIPEPPADTGSTGDNTGDSLPAGTVPVVLTWEKPSRTEGGLALNDNEVFSRLYWANEPQSEKARADRDYNGPFDAGTAAEMTLRVDENTYYFLAATAYRTSGSDVYESTYSTEICWSSNDPDCFDYPGTLPSAAARFAHIRPLTMEEIRVRQDRDSLTYLPGAPKAEDQILLVIK